MAADIRSAKYDITFNTLITRMTSIMPYMQDKDVFEVYANPDGKIWIDGKQHGREFTGIIMTPEQRLHIIQNVVALHGDDIIVGNVRFFV